MKKFLEKYGIVMFVFVALGAYKCFGQSESWYKNPSMFVRWTNFTALPPIGGSGSGFYSPRWKFIERFRGNGTDLAAVSVDATNSLMMIGDSTASPAFRRVAINWPGYFFTTITAVMWTNQYRDLFVGSQTGLYRFNDESEQLDVIWPWGWDAIEIADLGGEIAGIVRNWGSESGYHKFSPTYGEQFLGGAPWYGLFDIWADPISKTFGGYYPDSILTVRMASDTRSITFRREDYSTSDGAWGYLGTLENGLPLPYITDAYVYAEPDVVIVNTYYTIDYPVNNYALFIGKLGGTFYPLGLTMTNPISTFYYSRNSRLLIAGNSSGLYSAVLPSETQTLPVLSIRPGIVSWDLSVGDFVLEGATNVFGPWNEVLLPAISNNGKAEVAVPMKAEMGFFRLRSNFQY